MGHHSHPAKAPAGGVGRRLFQADGHPSVTCWALSPTGMAAKLACPPCPATPDRGGRPSAPRGSCPQRGRNRSPAAHPPPSSPRRATAARRCGGSAGGGCGRCAPPPAGWRPPAGPTPPPGGAAARPACPIKRRSRLPWVVPWRIRISSMGLLLSIPWAGRRRCAPPALPAPPSGSKARPTASRRAAGPAPPAHAAAHLVADQNHVRVGLQQRRLVQLRPVLQPGKDGPCPGLLRGAGPPGRGRTRSFAARSPACPGPRRR